MKRTKLILFSLFLTLFLVGCTTKESNHDNSQLNDEILDVTSDIEDNSNNVNNTEVTNLEDSSSSDKDSTSTNANENLTIRDISSTELVKEMNIGWSLGNTLDATGGFMLSSEISWGNPTTKKEMITAVKEAGFNVIRLPITWQNHMGPAPAYLLHSNWLDRVQEVVDYAIDNEMFVIINLHHEEWYYPSYDNLDTARTQLLTVWSQIAERFKDYDEHLIFEAMNEPRMVGTSVEWTGGNAEAHDVINQLNAAFVDMMRKSTNGNNPYRHLMLPTYAASSGSSVLNNFVIPEDNKVIVSVHAYTPYNFALNKSGTSSFDSSNLADTKDIISLFESLDHHFIQKGVPVILGEFGAMNKDNLEDRIDWAEFYVKTATSVGIPCIWWDNGAFTGDGENFGLLDRRELVWVYPEIVDALLKGLSAE